MEKFTKGKALSLSLFPLNVYKYKERAFKKAFRELKKALFLSFFIHSGQRERESFFKSLFPSTKDSYFKL
jgi:hypothetical protein